MHPGDASQAGFAFQFDWGHDGLDALAERAGVIVIVDVLTFSSIVCCAVESRAEAVIDPARLSNDARPCSPISVTDALTMTGGAMLDLTASSAATLALQAQRLAPYVLCGCLRNAHATARAARLLAGTAPIVVIANDLADEAGRRFGVEDLIGAGAVLAALDPSNAVSDPRCSPEAAAARAAFVGARPRLVDAIGRCATATRLIADGREPDLAACAALDVADVAAALHDGVFVPR